MRSFIPVLATIAHVSAFTSLNTYNTNNKFWGASRTTNTVTSSSSLQMISRRGRPKGPLRTIEIKPTMNREIKHDTLRVTTPSPKGKDEALGIMSKSEALAKAKDMGGLDLILINENSDPPVCKIVDYSKYRYQKEKKAKELKKNAKATEVKEVKMSYKIDVHDYTVRKKNAAKFINQGNRVKCTVMFKGRELQHTQLGFELLGKLAEELEDICLMEGKPKREGRSLSCFITPKPAVVKAINDRKRAKEKDQRRKKEKSRVAMEEGKKKKEEEAAAVVAGTQNVVEELSLDDLLEGADDDDDDNLEDLLGGDDTTDDLFG